MHDGAGSQERAIAVVLHIVAVVALGLVCVWSGSSALATIWQVVRPLLRLMLTGQEEREQVKPQRTVFSPEEYPGSLPCETDVRKAAAQRQQGNTAYCEGRYEEAVSEYSRAVLLNPGDHLAYSNRSACWFRMGRPMEALDDAELCVRLAPSFAKGYLRKGAAEQLLNRRMDAQASFKRGLSLDPENLTLHHSLRELRTDGSGALQATLYHVLFVSPHLQMDRLFQVLEDPDRLTASYVEQHKSELDAQYECLTQTLHVDVSLLLASPVLRDAYDRVTFACGQLLQWAPEAVSKNMATARQIVAGLGLAVRCGWSIHHGVAKFSANALTILATSEGAEDSIRREAVRLLLGGLLRWLSDPSPEPENPPEDRDVCGCTFLCARLSAATWLERLFEHGTKAWVREECERFPDILLLTVHLCLIVRDERAVPLGLPCLLRLPKVAKAVMEAEMVVDLSTCNKDPTGRKDGRRWANRQKGRGTGPAFQVPLSSTTMGLVESPSAGPLASVSELAVQGAAARCDASGSGQRSRSIPGETEVFEADARRDEANKCYSKDVMREEPWWENIADEIAANSVGPCTNTDVDALGGHGPQVARLAAPSQRLGEWMMTSLGYLLIFIDDDALFAAHACSALHRLATAVPRGVARLADGLWVGLPMLERLSALACQHSAALELLESLARHSRSARVAMCSLAGALAGLKSLHATCDASMPLSAANEKADASRKRVIAKPAASPMTSFAPEAIAAASSGATLPQMRPTESGVPGDSTNELNETEAQAQPAQRSERGEPTEPPDESGEPSWVECFHELCDELWVERPSIDDAVENGVMQPASSSTAVPMPGASARAECEDCAAPVPAEIHSSCRIHRPQDLVTLGSFEVTAAQVPVAAHITFPEAFDYVGSGAASLPSEGVVELPAVPAIWNPRFADKATGRLVVDTVNSLGSLEWKAGKQGAVVVLFRSAIQRSPATPDWATAVWLCHDAGARAAIVVNDLLDDGPAQPAFRMGLFGSPPPPIVAFMISGRDAGQLCDAGQQARCGDGPQVSVQSTRPNSTTPETEGLPELHAVPPWPLVLRMSQDVAQSWSLVETVHRAAPSPELARRLSALAERMGLPEKRVWLTRRLQRLHRGDTDSDEPEEPQLAFVECDRHGEHLLQLRRQLVERTGICAPDITGEFEVRFKDESSVGSAVMREWMDLIAQQAFLPVANHLLISQDHGKTFLPDPGAPFLNRYWAGDFELLGRLLGLAMWHQVTLDLPLHPYICKLLLQFDEELGERETKIDEDIDELVCIDPELYKNKVQWLLSNDISALGYEMPFADLLCCRAEGESGAEFDPDLPALPEEVSPLDALPGDEQVAKPLRLRAFLRSQVLLAKNGEACIVTEANKAEFVQRLLRWRLRDSLHGPVAAILKGVHAAVPREVLAEARQMLTPDELCALLAGSPDIDVDDWERNTRMAGGLSTNHQEVRWFWQTLRSWASDGRQNLLQNLLQFATGSRRVPVGGFAQLVGFNGGKHLFTLARGVHLSATSLPTSHACICTVDLAPWESAEITYQKLLAAAEAGNARFDEGMTHDD